MSRRRSQRPIKCAFCPSMKILIVVTIHNVGKFPVCHKGHSDRLLEIGAASRPHSDEIPCTTLCKKCHGKKADT